LLQYGGDSSGWKPGIFLSETGHTFSGFKTEIYTGI
jgi:hypothetical protein